MSTHILVIDDDIKLCQLLVEYLADFDFHVTTAHSAEEGMTVFHRESPALIILDIMLPGKDGFEICRELRRRSSIPIIMLTARGDSSDRIVGLEIGADDYLPKPFNPRELVARIKAVLRRKSEFSQTDDSGPGNKIVEKGPFELDIERRILKVLNRVVELTTVEFEIMRIFMQNSGIVLSRDRLLELSRDRDYLPFDRSMDVHISRLRQKIEADPKRPEYIKTVWGVGYVFSL